MKEHAYNGGGSNYEYNRNYTMKICFPFFDIGAFHDA